MGRRTRQEGGLVAGDQRTHVASPNLAGTVALCGAGRITQRIPGWFDPDDPLACAPCVSVLEERASG